ncbi:MAG TPA: hypothetical protein VFN49_02405 [Candidatus Aquilonibacter sp.]|nr:hypothetical protein [Candidatus Aquilonibacter sp.]
MTRKLFLVLAALVLLPLGAFAQEATPTPPANPMVFDDPAMHFVAPDGYKPLGQRQIDVDHLSDDPQVVAAWVEPGGRPKELLIQQQAFDGTLDGFVSNYTQFIRNTFSDAQVRDNRPVSLKNGMPAMYLDATMGSGFGTTKLYAVAWIDGQRGVVISVKALIGELDEKAALKLLSNASAVRYPPNRG